MSILSHGFILQFMEQWWDPVFEEDQKKANTLASIDSATMNAIEDQFHRHLVMFEPVSVFESLQEEVLDIKQTASACASLAEGENRQAPNRLFSMLSDGKIRKHTQTAEGSIPNPL